MPGKRKYVIFSGCDGVALSQSERERSKADQELIRKEKTTEERKHDPPAIQLLRRTYRLFARGARFSSIVETETVAKVANHPGTPANAPNLACPTGQSINLNPAVQYR